MTGSVEMPAKHILFVDDFKDNRDVYEYFLTRRGFRVTVASDGQEALDKTFALRPDLVIMDLSLPHLSGWEVTQRIKADERTRHIPVVILSGHDLSKLAGEFNCDGMLEKPCMPNALMAEITRVLMG